MATLPVADPGSGRWPDATPLDGAGDPDFPSTAVAPLVVGDNTRIISARKATPRERKQYEGESL